MSVDKHIVVTGADGMLGQDLLKPFPGYCLTGLLKQDLDITDPAAVDRVFTELDPDIVINAAAFNAVDDIETDKGYAIALAVNAQGPANMAATCKRLGIRFVHVSTDYVFDGEASAPYAEDAEPHPISRYGDSKRQGELMVLAANEAAYVARTCRLFGHPGASEVSKESFVDLMVKLSQTRDMLDVVDEEVASPSYSPDVALQLRRLATEDYAPGIYHAVNEGACTWYGFATEIFDIIGKEMTLNPVGSDTFPRPARRPAYSALANTKLPALRTWQEALRDYLEKK